ncbi:hypothetical protein [Paeniglutamicibacter psychrophenolicus]|uniref:hypothetical protein n=1 Tax=Paeniglutamicibacter psychrophenolicus TaxID=257454 RepID=UPI002784A99E|nr:hypothetical protein [Paeniglutamicibacter psychrophenolicus]MDQ0093240.1 hypothetical protein [Paeniglutamicibacter psychrophenolicus]
MSRRDTTWRVTRPVLSLIFAGVLATALLAGCSVQNQAPASTDTNSPVESAAAEKDAPARVVSVDTGTVIAQQEYKTPGSKDDKVAYGVQSLVVEGKTMVLKLVFTPDFASVSDSEAISVYDMTGNVTFNPRLVYRENLKEYSLLTESVYTWATDRVRTETTNHEPVIWWGVYAAPKDDNDAFDLRVLDAMAEFPDIPVQR